MASKLGHTFKFGTNPIVYQIDDINPSSNYYKCKQISTNNDFPLHIYLSSTQLNHVTQHIPTYTKGTTFTMASNQYSIQHVNEKHAYYECTANTTDQTQNTIYLSFSQLNFVQITSEEKQLQTDDISLQQTFTLAEDDNESIDFAKLSKILPYFTDFMSRKEASVLNQNNFINDPRGFLKAIRNKYNIAHPRKFSTDEVEDNGLRPWIEGKMQKLMAQTGFLGAEKWKTRLFRLFDEALVWFDDEPSLLQKIINIKNKEDFEYMTPHGILPLAMISGLKTADIIEMDEHNVTISENELLRLELQIGDEGVIILKCSDFNQRIKWYECLHSAIFTVHRPLFVKDRDLWRISEPKVNSDKTTKFKRQMTKEDVLGNDRKRKQAYHVRMGRSVAFLTSWTAQTSSPSVSSKSHDSIELPDIDNMSESNKLKHDMNRNSVKVL